MKKKVLNILAVLAVVGGLVLSATAPWWVVWFGCFPAIYAGALYLIKVNTDWITNY